MNPRAFLCWPLATFALLGCRTVPERAAPPSDSTIAPERAALPTEASLVDRLVKRHGEAVRARAERGVKQVLAFWRPADGDGASLEAFVDKAFVPDAAGQTALLERFSKAFEQLDGHLLEIGRAWRSWSELEVGPQLPVDERFAAFDVGAHVSEDLFDSKLAFVALLNFPQPTLEEMNAKGPSWSRQEWAMARLTRRFALRPSGAANQARAEAEANAEAYIAGDNFWMHHLLSADGKRLFPKGMRLLTHWNLRDQIKADYATKDRALALARQRLILQLMDRIVEQSLPLGVIDDPRVDWNLATHTVMASPPDEVETEQMAHQGKRPTTPRVSTEREPDTRYAVLLADFNAVRKTDADSPLARTEIARRFELDDEPLRGPGARAAHPALELAVGAEGGGPHPAAAGSAARAV